MRKIKFEKEDSENKKTRFLYARFERSSEPPEIILFLIRKHIVKDEASARRLILLIIIVLFLISLATFTNVLVGPEFIV